MRSNGLLTLLVMFVVAICVGLILRTAIVPKETVILVDTSSSMEFSKSPYAYWMVYLDPKKGKKAVDLLKQGLGEYVNSRKGGRIGLVVFGGPYGENDSPSSLVLSPLTTDYAHVLAKIEEIEIGMVGLASKMSHGFKAAIPLFSKRSVKKIILISVKDADNR